MAFMRGGAPIGFTDCEDLYFAAHEYLNEMPSQQELSRAIAERWSSFGAPRIAEGDFDLAATAIVHGRMQQKMKVLNREKPNYYWKQYPEKHKRDSAKRYRGIGTLRAVLSQLEED